MKLSHTKIEKYKECPKKYDYYYNQKLRTTLLSSALFFGGAVGEAVQLLALSKMDDNRVTLKDALNLFDEKLAKVSINGVNHSTMGCPYIRYFKSDFDGDLLSDDDRLLIDKLYVNLELTCPNTVDELFDNYKDDKLTALEYSYANTIFYLSLWRKGIMLIQAYQEIVMPRIIKVHSIEKPIEIVEQSKGEDSIIGFIDMVCDFECDDGIIRRVVFDHKTASKRYTQDKIDNSQQLNLYDYCENVGWVGYIVMIKALKKPRNKPKEVDVQIMVKQTSVESQESMLIDLIQVLEQINLEEYNANTKSCFSFGRKCEYYKLCQLNHHTDDLIVDMSNKKD